MGIDRSKLVGPLTRSEDPLRPLSRLVDSWLIGLEARHRSPGTLRLYRIFLDELGAYLAAEGMPVDPEHISREHLEHYLIAQQRKAPNVSTTQTKYRVLHAFFNWLVDEDELTVSPMARMHPPEVRRQPVPLMPEEIVKRMLGATRGKEFHARRDHAILRVFCDTPLRRSEVGNLQLSHADLKTRHLTVVVKGNRLRQVPIPIQTVQAIDRYLRVREPHPLAHLPALWLGDRVGLNPTGVYQVVKRRAKDAGYPEGHPHLFRHLFAHTWLKQGGQEMDLMRLGGWRSRDVMYRYGESAADARAEEAFQRLNPGARFS